MTKYVSENSFDIDTKELYASGNEFCTICNYLDAELLDLFDKLTKVDQICWSGESANAFIQGARDAQKDFKKYNSLLREYGNFLSNTAEEYDTFPIKVGVE